MIVSHNPSEIDQNQLLEIRFSNLGSDDIIIHLSFNIKLSSKAGKNRMMVSNMGRAIVKKLAVKFDRNEILSVDDSDVFASHRDLWKAESEKRNVVRQGINP